MTALSCHQTLREHKLTVFVLTYQTINNEQVTSKKVFFGIKREKKLEVKNMTSIAKKGKRKKQKAGLNKSILDVGFSMLRTTIKYKVEQIGGVFVEVATKKVKPSQTCPKCGHQHKKTLDIRVHECGVCGYVQDRDIAAAEVMLYWAKGILPESGTGFVDADVSSSTSHTSKKAGSMKQLGQAKRQKSKPTGLVAQTQTSTK